MTEFTVKLRQVQVIDVPVAAEDKAMDMFGKAFVNIATPGVSVSSDRIDG